MALNDHDQTRIREYLLGKLSEDEQQKIEERLMVEDDLFDELEISKGELIEEYQSGELNQNERQWLEQHYLASTEGRQRHMFAAALANLDCPQPEPQPPSLLERLTALFKSHVWAVTAIPTVAVLIVGALFVFRPQPHTTHSITLAHTLPTRSSGVNNPLPQRVTLPPNTEELRATLELPTSFPRGTRFEAKLDNQRDTQPVSVVEQNEKSVTVVIPASAIPRGEYALKLIAFTTAGAREEVPGSYRFDIQ
jgi:hypothetical protein